MLPISSARSRGRESLTARVSCVNLSFILAILAFVKRGLVYNGAESAPPSPLRARLSTQINLDNQLRREGERHCETLINLSLINRKRMHTRQPWPRAKAQSKFFSPPV